MEKRYCLRHAAGAYWLLDVGQEAGTYKAPLQLNEMGADIIKMLSENMNQDDIICKLSLEYGVACEQIKSDVDSFFRMLASQGFEIDVQKGMVVV